MTTKHIYRQSSLLLLGPILYNIPNKEDMRLYTYKNLTSDQIESMVLENRICEIQSWEEMLHPVRQQQIAIIKILSRAMTRDHLTKQVIQIKQTASKETFCRFSKSTFSILKFKEAMKLLTDAFALRTKYYRPH